MNCNFSNPLTFTGEAPSSSSDIWAFSNINCDVSDLASTTNPDLSFLSYQLGTSTYDFYFKNNIGLGELIIITLLFFMFMFFIAVKVWDFIIGKKVYIKRKNS